MVATKSNSNATLAESLNTISTLVTSSSGITDACVPGLERAIRALDKCATIAERSLATVAAACAQARKAILSAIAGFQATAKHGEETAAESKPQKVAIQFVFAILRLWSRTLTQSLAYDGRAGSKTHPKDDRNMLMLSLAKNIEGVLTAAKLPICQNGSLAHEAMAALKECLDLTSALEVSTAFASGSSGITSFFRTLPVHVSWDFWRRCQRGLERPQRQAENLVLLLQASIDAVRNRSLAERKTALLNIRLDRLARLLVSNGRFTDALDAISVAIACHIEFGLLADAAEKSLIHMTDRIWDDPDDSHFVLGQSLSLHVDVQTSSKTGNPTGPLLYDDQGLPSFHRAVLLERQLTSVFSKTPNHCTGQWLWKSIEAITQLTGERQYTVWKLRFVSRMLHLITQSKNVTVTKVFPLNSIEDMLSSERNLPSSAFLRSCSPLLEWIIRCQWRFATGQMDKTTSFELSDELKQSISGHSTTSLLQSSVYDVRLYVSQVQALSEYLCSIGATKQQFQLLKCWLHLQGLVSPPDEAHTTKLLLQTCRLANRLGDTKAVGDTLAQIDTLLKETKPSSQIRLEGDLVRAEYLLSVSNLEECAKALQTAEQLYTGLVEQKANRDPHSRFETETSLCQAADIASRLAYQQGSLPTSLVFARQAVKLSTTLWTAIEKTLQPTPSTANGSPTHAITAELSAVSLSNQNQRGTLRRLMSYQLPIWLHERTLTHLGFLSVHNGVYQDALFYFQQVSKLRQNGLVSPMLTCNSADLALLHAYGGQMDLARSSLKVAERHLPLAITSVSECDEILKIAEAALRVQDTDMIQRCLKLVSTCTLLKHDDHTKATQEQRSKIDRRPTKAKTRVRTNLTQQKKQDSNDQIARTSHNKSVPVASVISRSLQARLVDLENEFLVNECVQDVDPSKAVTRLRGAPDSQLSLSSARLVLHKAIQLLSQDASTNTLAETALALPVRYKTMRKSGQMSLLVTGSSVSLAARPRQITCDALPSATSIKKEVPDDGFGLLKQANELLRFIEHDNSIQLTAAKVNLLYKTLAHTCLLASAFPEPLNASPLQLVLQSLVPKDVARARERQVIAAEEATATKAQVQVWPKSHLTSASSNVQAFQDELHDLVKVLPVSWSTISIGVSHDQQELLIAKVFAGSIPFLMRVPLSRPDLEGNEMGQFTLHDAREELLDIVTKANASCHDERGSGDKQTRKEWYAERETLDKRIQALLQNIETLWLGGFRGLLSGRPTDDNVLSSFGKSLCEVLDNHLPSRQRSAKGKTSQIDFHAHVLELFTSLKFEESAEYEDSVTDLLYFVVDILQFNGEQNAYDEIDFDAMLVDMLDVLRSYHAINTALEPGHIILILDKELASLPLESLPCLQGLSVSRMPSAGAIKERLDRIRSQSTTADHYSVPASRGAYMLNPSSDLTSTQDTFSHIFTKQLSHFHSITNRVPTESEFQSCLTDHPLFLYFGHGSGAQYIRGRSIRKLPHCAVTWLMGCSSAKMTECGELESYGMPNYYMLGNSMAVVGTLWDVTDREIDRFALRGMCEWGLLEVDESMEGVWKKRKGKSGKKEKLAISGGKGKTTLDEAVSRAREECMLRYLSGASVVVYGLPVMLE